MWIVEVLPDLEALCRQEVRRIGLPGQEWRGVFQEATVRVLAGVEQNHGIVPDHVRNRAWLRILARNVAQEKRRQISRCRPSESDARVLTREGDRAPGHAHTIESILADYGDAITSRQREAFVALRAHGTINAAARAIGIRRTSLLDRLQRATARIAEHVDGAPPARRPYPPA